MTIVSADSDMEDKLVQNFKHEGYSEVSLDWLEKRVHSGEVGSGQLMVHAHVSKTFLKRFRNVPKQSPVYPLYPTIVSELVE